MEQKRKKILVLGGTRFFGKQFVTQALEKHDITVATRGNNRPDFLKKNQVTFLSLDREKEQEIKEKLGNSHFDVILDTICYSSEDVEILLRHVSCKKYLMISSVSVYPNFSGIISEEDFVAEKVAYERVKASQVNYQVGKQQAEAAIVQKFPQVSSVRVRLPFVIGKDDYTKRLKYYISGFLEKKELLVNNFHSEIAFVTQEEVADFLEYLLTSPLNGAVNVANKGSISLARIQELVESKKFQPSATTFEEEFKEFSPVFNDLESFCLNLEKAEHFGYTFKKIEEEMSRYIDEIISEKEGNK